MALKLIGAAVYAYKELDSEVGFIDKLCSGLDLD
jgi:hypothetical protein